jgi:hypothetical protein
MYDRFAHGMRANLHITNFKNGKEHFTIEPMLTPGHITAGDNYGIMQATDTATKSPQEATSTW